MNLNKLDSYLVDSVEGKPEGCNVTVDYSLPPRSMRVSPDVFSQIKEFSDEDAREQFRRDGTWPQEETA